MGMTSLKITLPDEVARLIEDKVASGEYPNASAVVEDGLLSLQMRSDDDRWVLAQLAPAYEAYRRDPASARPADEVFDGVQERYRASLAQRSGR